MEIIYVASKDISALNKAFEKLNNDKEVISFMLLMADKNHYKENDLKPLLASSNNTVIGGVFPEIIYNGVRKTEGLILIPSDKEMITSVFDLDSSSEDVTEVLMEKFSDLSSLDGTLMVFADGLGTNKNAFLESVFNFFGYYVSYLGAGTGSLNFNSFKNIICNSGMYENAGIIGLNPTKVDIGVAHGWEPIGKRLKVTETEGKKIVSLNWEPAFEVYKRIVEKHSKKKFSENEFLEIAKSYPFGVAVKDSEMLIRDPYALEGNKFLLLDSIEQGEYVNIMFGDIPMLLEGAKSAKEKAFAGNNDRKNIFCVDCISRGLYMKDVYEKEIEIITGDHSKVNGVLGLGEIANTGESFLECYNKTIVVAKW